MHGVDKGDRFVNMYMPTIRNRSWKFAALVGIFYITISNTSLFKNNLLDEDVGLKENLENLAFSLSPNPKIPKEISVKASKTHFLDSSDIRGVCESLKCIKKDKRTPLFCSNCKKYFHEACFFATHND